MNPTILGLWAQGFLIRFLQQGGRVWGLEFRAFGFLWHVGNQGIRARTRVVRDGEGAYRRRKTKDIQLGVFKGSGFRA